MFHHIAVTGMLRQSEEPYRLLFETNPHPSYIVDVATLRLTAVNQAMIDRYGYSRDELLTMTIDNIWPAQHAAAQMTRRNQWSSGSTQEKNWLHQDKQGRVFEVELFIRLLVSAGKPLHLVQAHDVTAQRALEARLRKSQRMEAIGRLAAGIAHDFNNMLTIINGYSDLALEQLPPADPLRKNLEEIQKAGFRAASLTHHLLAFSRRHAPQPVQLKLNSLVTELGKMLTRLLGDDVELKTLLDPLPGSVQADPGHMEQVLMNLAIIARDAMPKGGKLTIQTGNASFDLPSEEHCGIPPGSFVLLTVNAAGIGDLQDPAPLSTASVPGSECRPDGGLDLAAVSELVRESGGHLRISAASAGAITFHMYFPRVDETVDFPQPPLRLDDAHLGTETILLAEDEDPVRMLAHRVLEKYGYRVLAAADGDAAIAIAQRCPDRIHLLVTDLVMPEMNGRELFARLSQLRDDLKVLYMSGYTQNAVAQARNLESGTPFVQKPFVPETLASAVRKILDSSADRRS